MAEEAVEYTLTTESGLFWNREVLKKSRGYTGKGNATYPNGDTYEGHFVDGVI